MLPISRRIERWRARALDARAASIPDPAEKLRFLREAAEKKERSGPWRNRKHILAGFALLFAGGLGLAGHATRSSGEASATAVHPSPALPETAAAAGHVWLVESDADTETYSNGLRIERGWETRTRPRFYGVLRRQGSGFASRTEPAGIVFHTSESTLAPFDAAHNENLRANGKGLLAYVRDHALYHFVIDRFGRVFRIVAESDYANHAGHSLWADEKFAYFDLNQPFLGISFEAQSEVVHALPIGPQIASARLLVEMLRSKYGIADGNCVTHAQVSVNPGNMQIGYHTDWAAKFPFREVGLRGGYDRLHAAVLLFGFSYGQDFLQLLGGRPWPGLVEAERQLVTEAAVHGITPEAHRKVLQRRYRSTITASRRQAAADRKEHHEN